MADTQVRMANHIHEKVKAIAGKRNVSIKEIYEEALTRYIEAEAQEEILRETHIEEILNNRISKTEDLINKSVERLASLEARVGIDNSMALMGVIVLLEKLLKLDRKDIQNELRKQGVTYFSTATKEDKNNKKV
jgi:predicted transcriptional regulator